MKIFQLNVVALIALVLLFTLSEAKKRKYHRNSDDSSESSKTKTKTKWSSSSNLAAQTKNAMVASEEHGYYVRRTFQPLDGDGKNATGLKSPPFLAIPIAWFPCKSGNDDCFKLNVLAVNSNKNILSEGFLCDDDCSGPFEPICGKTSSEVAVFYNKCKLNVAKCRSHGYWSDLAYEECKTQYPEEVKYAEMKFGTSPYFKRPAAEAVPQKEEIQVDLIQTENSDVEEATKTDELLLIQDLEATKPEEKSQESGDI